MPKFIRKTYHVFVFNTRKMQYKINYAREVYIIINEYYSNIKQKSGIYTILENGIVNGGEICRVNSIVEPPGFPFKGVKE